MTISAQTAAALVAAKEICDNTRIATWQAGIFYKVMSQESFEENAAYRIDSAMADEREHCAALVEISKEIGEVMEKLDVTFPMWNVRPLIDRLRSALAEIESK